MCDIGALRKRETTQPSRDIGSSRGCLTARSIRLRRKINNGGKIFGNLSYLRVFGWQLFHGFLPTDLQLKQRHLPVTGICWGCRVEWGSLQHSLLFCPLIKEVWRRSVFWWQLSKLRGRDFTDVMLRFWEVLDRDEFREWLVLLWLVWKGVCQAKHEGKPIESAGMGASAGQLLAQFDEARAALASTVPSGRRLGDKRWQVPPPGGFRVDVDALFNPKLNRYGIGVIIRDDKGRAKLAYSRPMGRVRSVLEAELIAMLYGVGLGLKHQLTPMLVFTDSVLLTQVIKNGEERYEMLKYNADEILLLVKQGFIKSITHCRRSAMQCAHALAQFSGSIPTLLAWREAFPDWLNSIVSLDLN